MAGPLPPPGRWSSLGRMPTYQERARQHAHGPKTAAAVPANLRLFFRERRNAVVRPETRKRRTTGRSDTQPRLSRSTGGSCSWRWPRAIRWHRPTRLTRCGTCTCTYTRAYWNQFCGEVLGTPIHHAPSRGGLAESQKFEHWYNATLQSYRRLFGEEPPPDVWPETQVRFSKDHVFQRINTRHHWIIQKPRVTAGLWATGLLVASTAVAALVDSRDSIGVGVVRAQLEFIGESLYGVGLTAVVGLLFLLSFIRQRRCTRCGRFWVLRV